MCAALVDLPWSLRLPRWGHKWVGFHCAAVFRQCPKSEGDLAFPNGIGKVESLANIINRGLIPAQGAKAKYTGLHALRHFYASWCINRVVVESSPTSEPLPAVGRSPRLWLACALAAWFEGVFHPLHDGIEKRPLCGGIGNGQDVHNVTTAGEHHLFIIDLFAAIAA